MLLNVGPCLRLSAAKLAVVLSALLVLPAIVFLWFGHVDRSTTEPLLRTADYYTIPPRPQRCHDTSPDVKTHERRGGTARVLSPDELICRPVDTNATGIPRLFHQSWKSTKLPSKFERWSQTCRDAHPDWEWVLWTDDDNHNLVKTYFPWLESTYLGLPGPIYRADFSRNLYMYMFGGVYADLDLECLRPTEALEPYRIRVSGNATLDDDEPSIHHRPIAVFGRLGSDESFEHSIPNAWMASTPRHPFFALPIESARAAVASLASFPRRLWPSDPSAERTTGPVALRAGVLRWKSTLRDLWAEVVLLPPDLIYPFSWKTPGAAGWVCSTMSDRFDERACEEQVGVRRRGSLTLTFWSHTHDGAASNEDNIAAVDRDR